MIALALYMATDFATVHTAMMSGAKFYMPKGATQISSLDLGGNLFNWLILKFAEICHAIF